MGGGPNPIQIDPGDFRNIQSQPKPKSGKQKIISTFPISIFNFFFWFC